MDRLALYLLVVLAAISFSAAGCARPPHVGDFEEATTGTLVQVTGYGDGYDHMNMWKYVPAGMPPNAPLVLALHPCGYTSPLNDFASKTGWSTLADQYKFYVVYPEQIAANNSLYCFNWAGDNTATDGTNSPANLTRGMGENQELINMVKQMESDYSIDPTRVFITGFSGGGAQTALMLAVWPDLFAAGASLEGVPYHCTLNKNEVSNPCMNPGRNLTAQQWGDYVRMALPAGYAGPWPRLQIWEGASDTFVGVDNVSELVKQWTNVRGIAATPISDKVNGNDHAVYKDGQGNVVIESFVVSGMSHGVALDPTKGCGTADGNYYIDKGICSTQLVAEFFGLQNPPNPPGGDGGVGSDGGGGSGGGGGGGGGSGGGGGGGNWQNPGTGSGGSVPPAGCHGCSTTGGDAGDAVCVIFVGCVLARRRWARHVALLLGALGIASGCGVDARARGANGGGGGGGAAGNGGSGGAGSGASGGMGVPQSCPGGGTTVLAGKVFAPNGSLPLYNAIVYVPSTPVAAFTDGASCDVCDGHVSGKPLVWALTGPDGSFTMKDTPWGANVPLVIQIGKWRRQVTLASVTSCQSNTIDPSLTRLPKNHQEGDMPRMAIATGRLDPMECLLLKIGIDAAEIQPTGAGTRVEFFTAANQPGTTMPGAQSATTLYASLSNLLRYDLVLFPCEGAEYQQKGTDLIAQYVDKGGRLFTTHYSYDWLTYAGSPFNAVTQTPVNGLWNKNQTDFPLGDTSVSVANLMTGFPKGQAFAQWLVAAGAASTPSTLGIQQLRHDIDDVDPNYAQAWATDVMPGGKPGVAHLTFNTPLGASCPIDGPCQYCGRVVFSDFHVTQSGVALLQAFPAACTSGPMTDQEKALAFMLFDLSSCVQSDGQPPTPIQ